MTGERCENFTEVGAVGVGADGLKVVVVLLAGILTWTGVPVTIVTLASISPSASGAIIPFQVGNTLKKSLFCCSSPAAQISPKTRK